MSAPNETLLVEFERAVKDCQRLYHAGARTCAQQLPNRLPGTPESFQQLMDDLHKGLLIKVYVSVVQADSRWTGPEKRFAERLFEHIWPGGVPDGKLREAANRIFREAGQLTWHSLVRPFQQFPPLHDRIGDLQSLVERLANLIARADGDITDNEATAIRTLQAEIHGHLQPPNEAFAAPSADVLALGGRAFQQQQVQQHEELELLEPEVVEQKQAAEERLAAALTKLDGLIGLQQVKQEIRTLTNFLKVQQQRVAAGLPRTKLSLHMVFGGNPGTGKTTVARIVGEIYGAMGILKIGHLVETDRSGLVAEYAGQTGPKSNKKIDEALDGVLFIDEAYSLVAESGDDPYGKEALQTLLKRMEDNRDQLVVILAGYPDEMDRLLKANPGLTSRFNTKLTFEDYLPGELGRIFGGLCEQNHYVVPTTTQVRTLLGFRWLYENRDEHFGNGRLVRNTFETAIRNLANRVSETKKLTKELLTTLAPEDLAFANVPSDALQADETKLQFRVACPGCADVTAAPASFLGRKVRCARCQHRFVAAWGEPVEANET